MAALDNNNQSEREREKEREREHIGVLPTKAVVMYETRKGNAY